MTPITEAKLRTCMWLEYAMNTAQTISQVMHQMGTHPECNYKQASHVIMGVLDEWKKMAGVPVISVFERVDRMPVEVREALTKYMIKLEASN